MPIAASHAAAPRAKTSRSIPPPATSRHLWLRACSHPAPAPSRCRERGLQVADAVRLEHQVLAARRRCRESISPLAQQGPQNAMALEGTSCAATGRLQGDWRRESLRCRGRVIGTMSSYVHPRDTSMKQELMLDAESLPCADGPGAAPRAHTTSRCARRKSSRMNAIGSPSN